LFISDRRGSGGGPGRGGRGAGRELRPVARREPERTCVGCRQTAPKRSLLRVVRSSEQIVRPDPSGSAAGRGAYVHRDVGCVDLALRRGGMARALRAGLNAEEAARLRSDIDEEMERS
jgi:predicted RNA-binding protein YlxR (DUF448 family)